MQNEPIEVTIEVTRVLEKLNIPYLIGDSLASTLYGMIRTTQDSDIVAEMRVEHLQPFVSALQDEFHILDPESAASAIKIEAAFITVTIPPETVYVLKPDEDLVGGYSRYKRVE